MIRCFSFMREVEAPVHITPEEFDNRAFFLRLRLPSTLLRQENGAFRNRRNLKTPALRFSVDRHHFEENDGVTIIMIIPCLCFTLTQIQNDPGRVVQSPIKLTQGTRGFFSRAADGNPSLRFGAGGFSGRRPTARAAKRGSQ